MTSKIGVHIKYTLVIIVYHVSGFPRILENGKYLGISFYTFLVGKWPWKLKNWSKSGIYLGNLYWKRNFLTTGSFDAICQFRVTSLGTIFNSSLALFVPIIIKASTIGKKKEERYRDELITWIWICNVFVEVVQVNVTWISSDDGDQYSITREEIPVLLSTDGLTHLFLYETLLSIWINFRT